MERIENYEQYCKAFVDKMDHDLNHDAELLLFVQDWIIKILSFVECDSMDYSLKKLLKDNSDKTNQKNVKEDALSNIIDDTNMAFKYLSENLREKILRENVQMPVYKVKEINSYGLNWLSRQSGRTIKQKISSAGNSIMAVQRRMSFDTAENRLFIAFAKELYEKLLIKLDNVPEKSIRFEEEEFRNELSAFLYRKDIKEIKRWDNLPPNNTLLSDQNYKKIWHGWNELKKLDVRISNDFKYMNIRLATIFFVELLTQVRNVLKIPQEPIEVDYDNYNLYLCDEVIYCLDGKGNKVKIWIKENIVYSSTIKGNLYAKFEKNHMIISLNGNCLNEYDIIPTIFSKYVQLFITKMGIKLDKNRGYIKETSKEKHKDIIIDIFSLHPQYISENGNIKKLQERILQQKYHGIDINGDERDYYIPCGKTNAIKIIDKVTETYTIPYAVDNGSMEQMKRLMHMMENYILTDNFTYTFPDAYNEFQLSMVHKASRMAFRKVENVPYSIGVVFEYQQTEDFKNKFKFGDFILVLNLVDDDLTYTLLSGVYDEEIEKDIPEYKGIVWERYPTSTSICKESINDKIINYLIKLGCDRANKVYKLFGIEGIRDEVDQLSLFFGDCNWYEIEESAKNIIDSFALNITDNISKFLEKNSSIIKGKNVHIISLVKNLIYKGNFSYQYKSMQNVLLGCMHLKELQKRSSLPLWHDYLPSLAIKLMYGKFDLIKNAKVVPKFDKKQKIYINNTFTLPKNCAEYHFNLVQDDNVKKMQYEAVIKNLAFPLKNEVECKLLMTYQYGTEEPYELIFVPLNIKDAGFVEAKVNWSRLEEYPYLKLNIPEFPHKLNWEDLKIYPGRKGDLINVYDQLKEQYKLINNGYETYDVSQNPIRTYKGNRCGEFFYKKSNKTIKVLWNEWDWEKGAEKPKDISVISFLLSKDDKKNENRYRIRDLYSAKTRENLWFLNKNGGYQCIVSFKYQGEEKTIAIIDQQFDMPENFHTGINDVSFEVKKLPNGNLRAVNIHDEDGPEPVEVYIAKHIHSGNTPPKYFINSYYGKWTRTLFANNRSLSEEGCPSDFRRAFMETVNNWVGLFYKYDDMKNKEEMFTFLSLAAKDIGQAYYDIAKQVLEMYSYGEMEIPYEIGCALCDLTNDMQKELLEDILKKVDDQCKIIGILSKAMWHNEQFVFNIDLGLVLDEYFPKAVDYIGKLLETNNGRRFKSNELENIKNCLEFILGILRIRSLNDVQINKKYLSLNNGKMRQLYKYLECIVDRRIPIYSFFKIRDCQ